MWGNKTLSAPSSEKKLSWFILLWLLLNIIQATFMELYEDEGYYWTYSRFLEVGYFDHPPMIAFFIKTGSLLFQDTLGLRLISVVAGTCSVLLLWRIVKEYAINISIFALLFATFLLFHLYSFIATPDSPLFFFSVLFFYCYQRYLKHDTVKWSFCLAIVVACLLYSKYHGALILLFTLLSNPQLLKRSSFWRIVILALVFYLPHIWWQIQHDFPTIAYQLSDRSARAYSLAFTTEYLWAQLIVVAPLVGWYFFISARKVKIEDQFIRSLKFTFYGIFLFFLVSTLKGRVEAHWTLSGMIPLFILTYINLSGRKEIPQWVKWLSITNLVLIIVARFLFIIPFPFTQQIKMIKKFRGNEAWVKQIKEKAGENYVVFNQGFQQPSKYNFYTRSTKGFAYNSIYYRKNQYDIWPIEDSLRGKRIYYVSTYPHVNISNRLMFILFGDKPTQDSFFMEDRMHYGRWIENIRLYQKVEIKTIKNPGRWKPNETQYLDIEIYNPYKDTISFSNTHQQWKCFFDYSYISKGKIMEFYSLGNTLEQLTIPPGEKRTININIKTPTDKGRYKLIFSLRTEPFAGTRNSKMIDVNVK